MSTGKMRRCGWDFWKNIQTTELKVKRDKNWRRTSEIFITILPAGVSIVSGALPNWNWHEGNGIRRRDFDYTTTTRKPHRHRRALSGRDLQEVSFRNRARRRCLGLHQRRRAI